MAIITSQEILREFIKLGNSRKLTDILEFAGIRKYTAYVVSEKRINPLGIEEEFPSYLMVKKKWIPSPYWMNDRVIARYKHSTGITLPDWIYNFMDDRKNYIANLILYIINDEEFYIAKFGTVKEFAKKYGTFYEDKYMENVIAMPKDLFITHEEYIKHNEVTV